MAITNIVVTVSGPGIESQSLKIIPNSWSYNEGTPEKVVRAVVTGDRVEQEFSNNYENAFSEFKFSLAASADYLELTRQWEFAANSLLITATGLETVRGIEKTWNRSFSNASVTKTEKPMGADTVLEVAGMSDSAV